MAVAVPLYEVPREESVSAPEVSVVLVAYNSGGALLRCLASVDQVGEGVSEVVIVNNGLPGPELEIAAQSPRVRIVSAPRNIGFGAGCNLGAANARGDVLVFLNPDTVAVTGAIGELVATLDDGSVAIAMARLRLLQEPQLLNSCGNVVHISGLGWAGGYGELADDVTEFLEIASPSGAAMAMRTDDFRRLGGFREELFLYQEDLELGWRAHMRGLRVVLNPNADIYHDYDFDRHERKRYFLERNRLAFLLLDFSLRTLLVLAPVLLATEVAMCLLALRQGWFREKLRGWGWCLRSLPVLARHRRETQRARRIDDRRLVKLLTPTIAPGMMEVPALVRLFNPLLAGYWAIALKLI